MAKHAYLIAAHDNSYVLERLLRLIDDERNSLFIHLDTKFTAADPDRLAAEVRHAAVTFIPRRPVAWAHYSSVDAVLRLFETAVAGEFAYYHVLSGPDLPLHGQDHIHRFFDEHQGAEFVGFTPSFRREWVSHVHVLTARHRGGSRAMRRVRDLGDSAFGSVQRRAHYDRAERLGWELAKGSDWHSTTHQFVETLVDEAPDLRKLLRYSLHPLEFYCQTALWNSPLRERVYRPDDELGSSMRLIDWRRGSGSSPYVFRDDDFDLLSTSARLFARKFRADVDQRVVDRLYEHVMQDSR